MQKNVAGQRWTVFAFDTTDLSAVTGDAANITANLYLDGVVNAVDDTNPTEKEDGYYDFDITQAESDADHISMHPASSTGNVQVIGVPGVEWTTAPNANLFAIDGSGRVDLGLLLGSAVATPTVAGVFAVDLTHIMGTILTEGASGRLAAAFIKLLDVVTPLLVASDAMRGTDSAALASVATEARLAELDAANLPADVGAIPTTAMRGTDNAALASVATEARLAELGATNLPADLDTLLTRIVGLIATKAQMDTAHALLATPAQVNTEVSAVIKVDTSTLTPQGALTATPTIEEILVLLYKVIRNKTTQTATLWTLFADDGSTADQKSTVSDDATTFTKAEIVTGA